MTDNQWGVEFEMFVVDVHSKTYHGCPDIIGVHYDEWINNLKHYEMIALVGKFIMKLIEEGILIKNRD